MSLYLGNTEIRGLATGDAALALPELDNPATADKILSGYEAVGSDGKVLTGTIATKTSSNLTASGATVTAPAGYYASAASKSVATATQATPSISVDSAGLITASATQTAGYVTADTKSATKQLTVQAAKTVIPSTSEQTAVASGVYTTGAVTVAGDADLVPANIVSGKNIFGVAGAAEPASALVSELSTQDNLIAQIMAALRSRIPTPTFTIDGVEYQFDEGMTWDEWMASSYNTVGAWYWGAYSSIVINMMAVAYSDRTTVLPSDPIRDGHAYILLA